MSCELLPSFHRLETFLQFTSGFGLFTLQNKLRLNELVEAQSTQLPATVIEDFRSQKAFSDSNSTHSAIPPAWSIPVSVAKFIQHLCPEVKHFRPQNLENVKMNSIRFCYRRSEIEADKARRMRPQKFDSQIASPFVCSEIKSVDTKVPHRGEKEENRKFEWQIKFSHSVSRWICRRQRCFPFKFYFCQFANVITLRFFCLCAAGEIT